MVHEIRIPEMDDDAEEASIVGWKVSEGAKVEAGDVLCEIEAGKAVHEVTSPGEGMLRALFAEEGTLLEPGTLIAVVADESDDISAYRAG